MQTELFLTTMARIADGSVRECCAVEPATFRPEVSPRDFPTEENGAVAFSSVGRSRRGTSPQTTLASFPTEENVLRCFSSIQSTSGTASKSLPPSRGHQPSATPAETLLGPREVAQGQRLATWPLAEARRLSGPKLTPVPKPVGLMRRLLAAPHLPKPVRNSLQRMSDSVDLWWNLLHVKWGTGGAFGS